MSITINNAAGAKTVTLHLNNLKDVESANKDAHVRLERVSQSLAGRSYFAGGTVAILSDSSINVSVELRDGVDEEAASTTLRKAFFSA